MSSSSAIFTGNSQFATDFQQVVQRAVAFASLPMQQMQTDVATLQSQTTELNALQTSFSAVQSAISGIDSALGIGSYNSSVGTSTVASVLLSGTPTVGTFSLEVDTVGSYASAMSSDGLPSVADPDKSNLSDAGSFTLMVGTTPTTITPATKTLSSLVSAINNSTAGVQATLVNVGTTAAPRYRLSIQNSKLATTTIQLTAIDGTNPGQTLLTKEADGAPTTYRVNGIPKAPADPLTTDSPTITLAPGVSANLLAPGTTSITVSRTTGNIGLALSTFVSAYNSAMAEINKNRGQSKGALTGQSIVQSLSQTLHQISSYATSNGNLKSLTALGLSFDSNGVLSLDTSAFNKAVQGQIPALQTLLGSVSGGGFLKFANDALKTVTDSSNGIIQTDINSISAQIARENTSINKQQDRVDNLQDSLNHQMAAADAAISAMEQQYGFLSNMFESMRINAQNGG